MSAFNNGSLLSRSTSSRRQNNQKLQIGINNMMYTSSGTSTCSVTAISTCNDSVTTGDSGSRSNSTPCNPTPKSNFPILSVDVPFDDEEDAGSIDEELMPSSDHDQVKDKRNLQDGLSNKLDKELSMEANSIQEELKPRTDCEHELKSIESIEEDLVPVTEVITSKQEEASKQEGEKEDLIVTDITANNDYDAGRLKAETEKEDVAVVERPVQEGKSSETRSIWTEKEVCAATLLHNENELSKSATSIQQCWRNSQSRKMKDLKERMELAQSQNTVYVGAIAFILYVLFQSFDRYLIFTILLRDYV